jgi:hypothetical protein
VCPVGEGRHQRGPEWTRMVEEDRGPDGDPAALGALLGGGADPVARVGAVGAATG